MFVDDVGYVEAARRVLLVSEPHVERGACRRVAEGHVGVAVGEGSVGGVDENAQEGLSW